MPKLPSRKQLNLDYGEARRKAQAGKPLTSEERSLAEKAIRREPLVEGPWVVDFLDPEECAGTSGTGGMHFGTVKRIAMRPGLDPEEAARTFRHELGHAKHSGPWHSTHVLGMSTEDPKGEKLDFLLRELQADYFALSVAPDDELAKEHIREWKDYAHFGGDVHTSEIDEIDKLAREGVGYTGREIKWSPWV